jgi:phosphatidate phosphatase APP1
MKKMGFVFWIVVFILPLINGFLFDKEGLLLVPSVAFRDHSSISNPSSPDWTLYNRGWYYEENRIQALLMEKSLEVIVRKDLDRNRIKMFTAEGKKNKNLCIDGLNREMCTQTDKDGRIKNLFTITDREMQSFRQPGGNGGKVLFQVSVPKKNLQTISEVYLCDDNGITFISDIDDTIKITGVSSTTQTLINTFSGEFKAVPGMADQYRYWEAKYNATFAYLTASPDQLYPFLKEFFIREQFPSGSAHMRHFTWLDKNFIDFFMSADYMKKKSETLQMFLQNTNHRLFVLIGDIFQKDPMIYADIYAEYPNRIARIFIRKYNNDDEGQAKLEIIFKDVPRNKWATFETGDDLPKDIFI